MKITQTNGNGSNGIRGSRLRFYDDAGNNAYEIIIPTNNARKYLQNVTSSKYLEKVKNILVKIGHCTKRPTTDEVKGILN